jgi:hypothetical protein
MSCLLLDLRFKRTAVSRHPYGPRDDDGGRNLAYSLEDEAH